MMTESITGSTEATRFATWWIRRGQIEVTGFMATSTAHQRGNKKTKLNDATW